MDKYITNSRIDKTHIFKTKGEIPNNSKQIMLYSPDINIRTSIHKRCSNGFFYYKIKSIDNDK